MNTHKRILLMGLILLIGGGSVSWLGIRPRDPIFHGKPESYWIEHLSYRDEEQVKQWREFGPDGVRVLVRALDGASRPTDRLYRTTYRNLGRIVPGSIMGLLPAPRMDLTRGTRMNVVDLLSRLSKDAKLATPAMVRALKDESYLVRQLAITFFTWGEDEHCLLNEMEPGAKRDLLAEFIRLMQDGNWGVRQNAAVALRYYPEEKRVVVPVLVRALQDSDPRVRRLAAVALRRVDCSSGECGRQMK